MKRQRRTRCLQPARFPLNARCCSCRGSSFPSSKQIESRSASFFSLPVFTLAKVGKAEREEVQFGVVACCELRMRFCLRVPSSLEREPFGAGRAPNYQTILSGTPDGDV